MSPFTPAGERARWRVLYDLLAKTETGQVLTYEAMAGALGLDPVTDRHVIQMAFRRAAKEHLETDLRSTTAKINQGYLVVEAAQKMEIAKRYQGRGARAVRTGRRHIDFTDMTQLDDATRALFEAAAWKFAQQDEALHRLDVRTRRHERQLQAAIQHHQETAAQLTALQERLARLEARRET